MKRETHLKIYSRRTAIILSLLVGILMFIFLSYVMSALRIGFLSAILAIAATIGTAFYFYYLIWTMFKPMRELADYWDNLILYDHNYIPDLKRRYGGRIFRMRNHPVSQANYFVGVRMGLILPILLIGLIVINFLFLFMSVKPGWEYPGYYEDLNYMIIFANVIFVAIPIFFYLLNLLIFSIGGTYDFIVEREKDLVVISYVNQYTVKNFIPYDSIKEVKKIKKPGHKGNYIAWFRRYIHRRLNHPINGFYTPTLSKRTLISIKFRTPQRLLQYGPFVRKKKPKQYEYVQFKEILLEPERPDEFIKKIVDKASGSS